MERVIFKNFLRYRRNINDVFVPTTFSNLAMKTKPTKKDKNKDLLTKLSNFTDLLQDL